LGTIYEFDFTKDSVLKIHTKEAIQKLVPEVMQIKKSRRFSLFGSAPQDNDQNQNLIIRASLQALSTNIKHFDREILKFVFLTATNKNSETARSAIQAISLLVKQEESEVIKNVTPLIPKFYYQTQVDKKMAGYLFVTTTNPSQKKENTSMLNLVNPEKINLEDQFSKYYLLKIASVCIKNEENKDVYYDYIKSMIHDENNLIFAETIKVITENCFHLFFEKDYSDGVMSIQNQSVKNYLMKIIIGTVYHRLQLLCRDNYKQLELHASSTMIYNILKNYEIYVKKNGNVPDDAKFLILQIKNLLKKLLTNDCRYVRLQVFRALIWSPTQDDVKDIVKRLKLEMKANIVWSQKHIFDLLNQFYLHSRVKEEFIESFCEFCYFICCEYPNRIDIESLNTLFKKLKDYQIVIEYFLKMLFRILDNFMKGNLLYNNRK
jgi:hypothetical protein